MPTPVKAEVQATLADFHPRIRAVIEQAWREWREVADFMAKQSIGPTLYPRTVANFIFDGIARHAIREFASDPSINVDIETQTLKLFFKGAVYARFKKGAEDRLGQNIQTQAVINFIDPEYELPGLPPETARVEFIWVANELQTCLEKVLVVARNNDVRLWEYEIEPLAKESAEVLHFPTPADSVPGVVEEDDDDAMELVSTKPRDIEESEKD